MSKVTAVSFDDIKDDMDSEAELEMLLKEPPEGVLPEGETEETEEKVEGETEEVEAEETEEVEAEETEEVEAEETEEVEAEETEEVVAQEEEKEEAPKDDFKATLEELRAERARLQEQLNEITVTAAMDRRKLAEIEANMSKAKEEPVEEGPTADQILQVLDQRIAATDAALSKAEMEDPAAAPQLRQNLRQLERYYLNVQAQAQMQANKGPDPEALVNHVVTESAQQARFGAVKNTITAEYPMLNTNSDTFDPKLRDMVHKIYNPMVREGADPVDALIEATTLVARAHGIYSVSELAAINEQQIAAATKAQVEAPKKKVASATRKVEAVKKNVAAAAASAPNIANLGASNEAKSMLDKYDFGKMGINEVMRISDEELDKIGEMLALYDE